VGILDGLDVLALLHLAGEELFVRCREEEDLSDLTQIHADRVVDAFLVLEWDAGSRRFAFFFGFLGELYVWFRPDVATAAAFEHVRDTAKRVIGAIRVGDGNRVWTLAKCHSFGHKFPTFSKPD
jgi:hypothetical protein